MKSVINSLKFHDYLDNKCLKSVIKIVQNPFIHIHHKLTSKDHLFYISLKHDKAKKSSETENKKKLHNDPSAHKSKNPGTP
jgi:hypothetical protein